MKKWNEEIWCCGINVCFGKDFKCLISAAAIISGGWNEYASSTVTGDFAGAQSVIRMQWEFFSEFGNYHR
jgi:hypothetical protein